MVDGIVNVFLCEMGFGDAEADANTAKNFFVVRVCECVVTSLMETTAI